MPKDLDTSLFQFISHKKGLWNADKKKIQDELSDKIGGLIEKVEIQGFEQILKWITAGINILNKNWGNIDYHRLNKFLYLTRCFFTGIYQYFEGPAKKIEKEVNYMR